MHNRWNPYSDEVKNIPNIYWILALNFIQMGIRHEWEGLLKPQAELIGQISNPEVFSVYRKEMKKKERLKTTESGKSYYKTTKDGFEGGGVANAHYDPNKGLVDENGQVIIPADQYSDLIGFGGAMISY